MDDTGRLLGSLRLGLRARTVYTERVQSLAAMTEPRVVTGNYSSPWDVNYVTGVAHGATPKAKLGGGSLLLCFAVRAARQLAMIHPPTAADPSHPTTYPWDHSPSAQEV